MVSYAESDDDEEDVTPRTTQRRKGKKPMIESDDEEDTFIGDLDGADDDEGECIMLSYSL